MNMENERRKKPRSSLISSKPLWLEIFFVFGTLLVITVVLIAWNSFEYNEEVILEMSNEIIRQVSDIVIEKTSNYMKPAASLSQLTSILVMQHEDNGVELPYCRWLEEYALRAIEFYPQLSMFNFADEKGNFLMLKKLPDGNIATKIIDHNSQPPLVLWKFRDSDHNVVLTQPSRIVDFDPRTRPWYIGAKSTLKSYWSDLYAFFTDKKIGMAASHPVFDKAGNFRGVYSIDIEMNRISDFLNNLKIGNSGVAFIVNRKNQLVAFPEKGRIVTKEGEEYRPTRVDELEQLWIKDSFKYRNKEKDSEKYIYDSGGKKYLASFSIFPDSFQHQWRLVVIAPVDDFVGKLDFANKVILGFSFIVMAAAIILAIFLSRRVSRPIEVLTYRVKRMGSGEFDEVISIDAQYEIEELADAFNKMSQSLKRYVEELKITTAEKERAQTELSIGSRLQQSLLPIKSPVMDGFDIHGTSIPALEVGGDYFGYIDFPDGQLGIAIGDAAGKGLGAAMFVASCRAACMAVSLKTRDLREILSVTNRLLTRDSEVNAMFVTFFASLLDPQTRVLKYSNAGHNPPVVLREQGKKIQELPFAGTALGIFDDSEYAEETLQLYPGDIVFYYTDGVVEAKNSENEFYGKQRLYDFLGNVSDHSARTIIEKLTEDLMSFTGDAPQFDDITMVVIKTL